MTIASLDEFNKATKELSLINNEQWLNLPTYLRQELLQNMQKMLITLSIINKK